MKKALYQEKWKKSNKNYKKVPCHRIAHSWWSKWYMPPRFLAWIFTNLQRIFLISILISSFMNGWISTKKWNSRIWETFYLFNHITCSFELSKAQYFTIHRTNLFNQINWTTLKVIFKKKSIMPKINAQMLVTSYHRFRVWINRSCTFF